jgi:putative transposase
LLAAPSKSAHPAAKKALTEIWNVEIRWHALDTFAVFDGAYGAKVPNAVAKVSDDVDELLVFYHYPAEHWIGGIARGSPRGQARRLQGSLWRSS